MLPIGRAVSAVDSAVLNAVAYGAAALGAVDFSAAAVIPIHEAVKARVCLNNHRNFGKEILELLS